MELPVARRGKDERVSYWGCGDSFPRGGVGDENVMPMVEVVGVEMMCGKFSDMGGLNNRGGGMMGNAKFENYPISSLRRQRIVVTVQRMKEDNGGLCA